MEKNSGEDEVLDTGRPLAHRLTSSFVLVEWDLRIAVLQCTLKLTRFKGQFASE